MSNQKQVQDGGNATLSIKVSSDTYDLLNILAEGLQHGTNANDLLKMFVQAFIESARHTGPVSQDIQLLLDILKIGGDWNKAFNFADITKQKRLFLGGAYPDHRSFHPQRICGQAVHGAVFLRCGAQSHLCAAP